MTERVMTLRALVFDVDGTLADTEEAHRLAFNAAFAEHDLPWEWSKAEYSVLLGVTGGKERIRHYVHTLDVEPGERERLEGLVPSIHATKTRLFTDLVSAGRVGFRPGVIRLMREAMAGGLELAIASTTTPANVQALLSVGLGSGAPSWFSAISTGDVVAAKKPAPDIYRHALSGLGLSPRSCVAFEDSQIGVESAKAAGLYTVATPTEWTATQCFDDADLVLPSLGDGARPWDRGTARHHGAKWLDLNTLCGLHAAHVEGEGAGHGPAG